ncbi:MAG: nucleotide exchange factor GrpE [Actinobacteria bacterium]|nr:nucleotide exchange factor GrpE [Actinomycetota bacterium]
MSEHTTNQSSEEAGSPSAVENDAVSITEPIDPLVAERDAALEQRDEYKDIALRLQADFENYRKRAAAQTVDEIDRSTGKIAEALLPVLDACEAAFAHGVEGVEPIWSALIGALQKQGLEALDLQGKVFDPGCAEAVLHEPVDGDSNGETTVVEVLRTGYRWKGRVLRAAMVKVKG